MSVTFPVYDDTATAFKRVLPGKYLMTLTAVEHDEPSKWAPEVKRIKLIYRVDDITSDLGWPEDVTTADQKREYVKALKGSDHWERVNMYDTLGPRQALYNLLMGMLGRTITKKDNLDPAQFIGKQYAVTFKAVPWKMDDGSSGVSTKITDISPVGQTADLSWMTDDDTEGFEQ